MWEYTYKHILTPGNVGRHNPPFELPFGLPPLPSPIAPVLFHGNLPLIAAATWP